MTVTWQASTGVSTTGAAKGTTSTTVAYTGVAAGRAAILTVGCKPNTGTVATPSGWTKIGEQDGGTGTTGADVGQTKVAMYYKILDGTETGNVTVTGTSTTSIQGAMDVFSKSLGNWDLGAFVAGNDSSHAANRSAVCGAWSGDGLAANDKVLIGWSGDTDDSTTAISARSITQTGVTFGTLTARSEVRNTSGNQSHTYTVQADISAAAAPSASAPTVGFTWTVSSCGPAMVVRLRDYDAIATLTEDFSAALSGTKWGTGGTVTVSGGVGTFDLTTHSYMSSVQNYKFAGSSVIVKIADFPTTGSGYYFGIRVGPQGNGGADFIGIFAHGDGTLTVENTTGGNASYTLDETNDAWLRILHDGTDVYAETAPDGTTWDTKGYWTGGGLPTWVGNTSLEVTVEGAGGDSGAADNLNLPPSTTPVSGTLDLQWKVQNTVTGSTDLRWAVRSAISSTLDLRWAVQNAISGTIDLRWSVRNAVASGVDLRWAVLAQVNGAVDLRWAVLNTISSGIDFRWAVLATVSGSTDLRWAVRSALSGSTDLRWAVLNSVTGTNDLRWAVRNVVTGGTDLRWAVLAPISSTLDLRWAVLNAVNGSIDLRWVVTSSVTTISGTLDLPWAVRNLASGTVDLRWGVRSVVSGSLDLRWAVRALVAGTVDLRWAQLEAVAGGLDLRWATAGRVSGSLDLQWSVRNAVAGALSLPWAVRSQISGSLDLRWQIQAHLTGSMQLLWVVEGVEATLPPAGHVTTTLTDYVTAYFPERVAAGQTDEIQAYLGLWP